MATLQDICNFLNGLLEPEKYEDQALNGLQVQANSIDSQVAKVAVAVDSGLSVIEETIATKADLLIVHHGLFWGKEQAITGPLYQKLKALLGTNCSLYASHLPLDGNPEVGNAFELARYLELEQLEPFMQYGNATIGCQGQLAKAKELSVVEAKLKKMPGAIEILKLPFGPKEISQIGIVTGSGSAAIPEAKALGLDLLISGEAKQEAYHNAKEHQVNCWFAGHYATETFGVLALKRLLENKFQLETCFIDEPTGI